eukprot:TRINITY_DN4252_c0_g1_i1.p1 TRINITY_DN4252_c0_g1~~TRINITY_DN4252_c0_g1_i1.p1  ORF type:complete len:463 (+),score=90.27 TRINITY_DN4252_c0_g1_i1:325-1713(+)
MFHEFEAFSPAVLNDFIYILSLYREQINLVFVFGLSTSQESLHSSLSQTTVSLLRLERFKQESASKYLTDLLDKLVIEGVLTNFRIGPRSFQLLIDSFLQLNNSLLCFSRSFSYAIACHFFSEPLSFLCNQTLKEEFKKSDVGNDILHALKILPSVQRWLAADQNKKQLNKQMFMEKIKTWLHDIDEYHSRLPVGYRCFSKLMAHREKRQSTYYLAEMLKPRGEKRIASFVLKMKLTRPMLMSCLSEWRQFLSGHNSFFNEYTATTNLLQRLASEPLPSQPVDQKVDADSPFVLKNRRDIRQLAALHKNTPDVDPIIDICRDFILQFFRDHLRTHQSFPLHEIFYFDDVGAIKRAFNAEPRRILHQTLIQPSLFIKCRCCQDSETMNTMHYACIMYKILQESSRVLSLNGLYHAFHLVYENSQFSDPQIQAMFMEGLKEMQLIGVVKKGHANKDLITRNYCV